MFTDTTAPRKESASCKKRVILCGHMAGSDWLDPAFDLILTYDTVPKRGSQEATTIIHALC